MSRRGLRGRVRYFFFFFGEIRVPRSDTFGECWVTRANGFSTVRFLRPFKMLMGTMNLHSGKDTVAYSFPQIDLTTECLVLCFSSAE